MKWLRKAAEQGHLETQYELGNMYDEGDWRKGVTENDTEAVKWYRKAAEQGFVPAQVLLKVLEAK